MDQDWDNMNASQKQATLAKLQELHERITELEGFFDSFKNVFNSGKAMVQGVVGDDLGQLETEILGSIAKDMPDKKNYVSSEKTKMNLVFRVKAVSGEIVKTVTIDQTPIKETYTVTVNTDAPVNLGKDAAKTKVLAELKAALSGLSQAFHTTDISHYARAVMKAEFSG